MYETIEWVDEKSVGKEVLLKSIHQAILIHPMSLFKLPNNLTTELENMVARFWWSKVFTGLHGVSYVSLKGTGGLGFCNFSDFNKAMLAKEKCNSSSKDVHYVLYMKNNLIMSYIRRIILL